MAVTSMTTTNALTLKKWAVETYVEKIQRSCIGHLMSRGAIFVPSELLGRNARGDEITFAFAGRHTNAPVGEGDTLNTNEQALDLDSNSMAMNVTRVSFKSPNAMTIEQMRTNVDFEAVAKESLGYRAVEIFEASMFQQLAGAYPNTLTVNGSGQSYTGNGRIHFVGHNTPTAPTSERIVRAAGRATDETLTSADTFTLDLVDEALELAEGGTQAVQRLANDEFDLILHPKQVTQLKQDAGGKIQWYLNNLAALEGGKSENITSTIRGGMISLGKYANVNIYSNVRVANGVNSSSSDEITTVKRAVMVGANALAFASPFGARLTDKDVPMQFHEQLSDYGYYKGIECRLIFGMKKMTYTNQQDNATIVIGTYSG